MIKHDSLVVYTSKILVTNGETIKYKDIFICCPIGTYSKIMPTTTGIKKISISQTSLRCPNNGTDSNIFPIMAKNIKVHNGIFTCYPDNSTFPLMTKAKKSL